MRRRLVAAAFVLVAAGLAMELGYCVVIDRANRTLARLLAPGDVSHRATSWDPWTRRLAFSGLRIASPGMTATIDRLVLHPTLATLLGRGGDLGRVSGVGVTLVHRTPLGAYRYAGSFVIPSLRRGQARSEVSIGALRGEASGGGPGDMMSFARMRWVLRDFWSADPRAQTPMHLSNLSARTASVEMRDVVIGGDKTGRMTIGRFVAIMPDTRHQSFAVSDLHIDIPDGRVKTGPIDIDLSAAGAYDPRAHVLAINGVTLDMRGQFFLFADLTIGNFRPPSRLDDARGWDASALTATVMKGDLRIRDEGVVDYALQYAARATGRSVAEVASLLAAPAAAARHPVLVSIFGILRREGEVIVAMRPPGAVSILALAAGLRGATTAEAADPMLTPDLGITVSGPSDER